MTQSAEMADGTACGWLLKSEKPGMLASLGHVINQFREENSRNSQQPFRYLYSSEQSLRGFRSYGSGDMYQD